MGQTKRKRSKAKRPPTVTQAVIIPIKPQKHPMIALPIYGGKIEVPLFHALDAAVGECMAEGWKPPHIMFRTMDSVITRARNACVAYFMQKTPCTDLVFIDGDISWEPGHFARLMSHDVDIVAGVYRSRGEPEVPICYPLDEGAFIDPDTGLIEIAGVGTGFFRVTRAAVEKMIAAYGDRWYEDKPTAPGLKIPCLFDFEYVPHDNAEGGTYFSEDYTFCKRARAIGLKIWADPQLIVNHLGQQIYPFRLISYLNRRFREANPQAVPSTEQLAKAVLAQEDAA